VPAGPRSEWVIENTEAYGSRPSVAVNEEIDGGDAPALIEIAGPTATVATPRVSRTVSRGMTVPGERNTNDAAAAEVDTRSGMPSPSKSQEYEVGTAPDTDASNATDNG